MPGRVNNLPGNAVVVEPSHDLLRDVFLQIALPHRIGERGPFQRRPNPMVAHRHGAEQHDGMAGQVRQVLREDAVRLVPPKVVEQPLLLDEHPLAVRNVELHAGPIGLRDGVPTRRLQHDGGVEVDQEDAAGPLGGAEDRHRAVDVLRRGPDEVQAFRLPERPDELAFKIVLGSEPFVRPRPPDGRTLLNNFY